MESEMVGGVIAVIICVGIVVIASKQRKGQSDPDGDAQK